MNTQRRASAVQGSDARRNLVAATQALLQQGGVQAATSRAIADTADENLGSITYYFGSKDKLVHLALTEMAAELIQPVIDVLQAATVPLTKLAAAATTLQTILNSNRQQLGGYVQALAHATHESAVAEQIQGLHNTITATLTAELTTQKQACLIPDWVEPEGMAQLLIAIANGVAIAEATQPDSKGQTAGNVSQQLLALLTAAGGAATN